jgi:hypothetical protein
MKIKDVVTKKFDKYQTKSTLLQGLVGNISNGTIFVAGKTSMIYVTLGDGSVISNVANTRVPNILGLQVNIGYDPTDKPMTLQVLGVRDYYNLGMDDASKGNSWHHNQHEWPKGDTVYVWGQQFLPSLYVPVPGELKVYIYPGAYYITSGYRAYTQATEVDLTATVGGIAITKAKLAVIVVDSSGDFQVRVGAEVSAVAPNSAYMTLADTDLPTLTAGDTAICAVKCYYGQLEFFSNAAQNDFIDLRFTKSPGGGSPGGGGHTIEDEGTPLTNRSKLNFKGVAVVVTDDSGNDKSDVTVNAPYVNATAPGSPGDGQLWWDSDDEEPWTPDGVHVIAPASDTDNYIPQWDGTDSKTLKNGLLKATSIATPGVDSSLATEKAVRDAITSALAAFVSTPPSLKIYQWNNFK